MRHPDRTRMAPTLHPPRAAVLAARLRLVKLPRNAPTEGTVMRSFTARALMILALVGLTGCETMRGLGRDVNNVGDALMGK